MHVLNINLIKNVESEDVAIVTCIYMSILYGDCSRLIKHISTNIGLNSLIHAALGYDRRPQALLDA